MLSEYGCAIRQLCGLLTSAWDIPGRRCCNDSKAGPYHAFDIWRLCLRFCKVGESANGKLITAWTYLGAHTMHLSLQALFYHKGEEPLYGEQIGRRVMLKRLAARAIAPCFGAVMWIAIWYSMPPHILPDFSSFYEAGRLLSTPGLYKTETHLELQRVIHGGTNDAVAVFLRWPVFAAAIRPLSELPFNKALNVWRVLMFAALAGFIAIWPRRMNSLLALAWSFPAAMSLTQGQDTPLLLLGVAGAMMLYIRGQRFLAGVLLACAINKPQFFLLSVLPLVRWREWRVALGLAMAVLILFGVSCALQGPSWIVDYAQAVFNPNAQSHLERMPSIYAIVRQRALILLFSALAIVLVWRGARHGFAVGLCTSLVGALIISPHVYPADFLLALPILLMMFSFSDTRLPVLGLLLPFGYATPLITVTLCFMLLCVVSSSRESITQRLMSSVTGMNRLLL
jgi:hypothetical protein